MSTPTFTFCADCRAWTDDRGPKPRNETLRQCRREPPQAVMKSGEVITFWPTTLYNDGCFRGLKREDR